MGKWSALDRSPRRTATNLLAQALSICVVAMPAHATDESVQVLSEVHGADDIVLGLDSQGTATAAWTEGGKVRSAARAADGKFGTAVPIPGFDLVDELAFAHADDGAAIIVGGDNGAGAIVASVRSGRNEGFEAGVQVAVRPSGSFFGSPDVAISQSGRAVVTWLRTGSGGPAVFASLFDGTGFSAPVMLDEGDQLDDPSAGIDAAGNALVVWAQESATDEAIFAAAAPAGGSFGAAITVEQLTQGGGNDPDLAVNASGDAFLAYEDGSPDGFVIEARYGNVDGTFGAAQTTNEQGFAPGVQEVAIDDSGRAAILQSVTGPGPQPALQARVTDEAGALGPVQTISNASAVDPGPGVSLANMAIAGGAGEFTAVFVNDHNADGQFDEVYRSHTTGGTFGGVHQLSESGDDPPGDAAVARSASGDYVAGWDRFVGDFGMVPHAVPVGSGPALTQGTETDDDLDGSAGADVARLGAGNDNFNALGGTDRVFGEAGKDKLIGGSGNDKLNGEGGNDRLEGGRGTDVMNGGPGRDTCVGTKAEKAKAISCERFLPIAI